MGKTYKKTGDRRIEMARDFSVIANPYLCKDSRKKGGKQAKGIEHWILKRIFWPKRMRMWHEEGFTMRKFILCTVP